MRMAKGYAAEGIGFSFQITCQKAKLSTNTIGHMMNSTAKKLVNFVFVSSISRNRETPAEKS